LKAESQLGIETAGVAAEGGLPGGWVAPLGGITWSWMGRKRGIRVAWRRFAETKAKGGVCGPKSSFGRRKVGAV
jgi:hypothetical protein